MLTKTFSGLSEGQSVRLGTWIVQVVKVNPDKQQVTLKILNLDSPAVVITDDEMTAPPTR